MTTERSHDARNGRLKLLNVIVPKRARLRKLKCAHFWSTQYWMLLEDYSALIVTDEGTFHLDLKAGWITDWRSGSRALDIVAPKFGNGIYECLVFAHDTAYSGWVSKALADEVFVHQGFEFSGECGHTRAQLSYNAVRLFGSAYYMEDVMPKPYTDNRQYESLTLEAK